MSRLLFCAAAALCAAPATAQTATVPATPPSGAQPLPAIALPAPQVFPGATVYGAQGDVVGTVTQVENGIATIATGTHRVPLPVSVFRPGTAGPALAVTRVQLHQIAEQQIAARTAARDAALVAGAAVLTADGLPLGTVAGVNADNILVRRAQGRPVALQRQFFLAENGTLRTRLTLQDIDAAVAQAPATTVTQ